MQWSVNCVIYSYNAALKKNEEDLNELIRSDIQDILVNEKDRPQIRVCGATTERKLWKKIHRYPLICVKEMVTSAITQHRHP